jgi:hypothetical protein
LDQQPRGEAATEILARAGAKGISLTPKLLRKWHLAGELPRPVQTWTKRVEGSETIYPPGTFDQLCRLIDLKKTIRSSKRLKWTLWWVGFPIHPQFWRQYLQGTAERFDKAVPYLLGKLADENEQTGFLKELRTSKNRDVLFRQLRRRLTGRFFGSFVFMILEILQGEFRGWSRAGLADDPDMLHDRTVVDRAFGLSPPATTKAISRNPIMHGDIERALDFLSSRLGGAKMTEVLRSHSDEEVIEARNELRSILFCARMHELPRKKGFGLYLIQKFETLTREATQALMLLFYMALREDRDFRKQLELRFDEMRSTLPKDITSEQIETFRRIEPAIAAFAFPTTQF